MRLRRLLTGGVLVVVTFTAVAGSAGGAGITTHRWMAETALDQVSDTQLKTLLTANFSMLQTGTAFPDVGYVGSNTYGETAHWQRFVDNLIEAIRARDDCGSLADPDGPCAPLIAFTFGIAAHGMGDEVWDWLFEPNSPDRDEYWTGVPTANDGGAETQMDIVAVGRYGVARPPVGSVPDVAIVLAAFTDSGEPGITPSQFDLVPSVPLLWDVEKGWADDHLAEVEAAMPWMSDNLVTAPGGVDFAATAIAGYWSSLWGHLLGQQPATSVSITYPAPGETDVPATGWDRASFQPGSSPGRGGARNRIAAVLTSARPYTGASGGITVSNELPTGSMTITDLSTNLPVPLKSSYPRSVPYGSDGGEHTIDTQPAANLAACTWYRVDVSPVNAPVLDARGDAVTPYSWQFRTECDDEPTTTTLTTTSTTMVPSTTLPVDPSTTSAPPTTSAIPTSVTPSSTTAPPVSTTSRRGSPSGAALPSATAAAAVGRQPDYTG